MTLQTPTLDLRNLQVGTVAQITMRQRRYHTTVAGQAIRERIYGYIVRYKSIHDGNSPSTRGIAVACEVSSTSQVYLHLRTLEAEGRIRILRGTSRQIEVVGGHWTYSEEGENATKRILSEPLVRYRR